MQENPMGKLVHSTVRIECDLADGGKSTGTGYFYDFFADEVPYVPCIVTNKHVARGAVSATIFLTIQIDGKPQLGAIKPIIIQGFESKCIFHSDKDIDLAVLPIADIISGGKEVGEEYYMVPLDKSAMAPNDLLESLSPMEDVVMIGYPNGIWDSTHNLPIIRRGITATHPSLHYNGKPEFVIDAACFPGSSGSPVFLANIGSFVNPEGRLCAGNRVRFLGTLYAGPVRKATGEIEVVEVPTDTRSFAVTDTMINLGYIIRADKLNDFEPVIRANM
ncbi:S1 family peptidase [Vibrio crassostreae]|uniref:S1 family peptidase n=1 Tax=Vibrio crassostreae TaxID=246167 RepID=UPI001046141B|nr:serine protease [Vibrio crassostreae]TCV29217.1 trypsin-like peptidase [Vibrio crassostreae]